MSSGQLRTAHSSGFYFVFVWLGNLCVRACCVCVCRSGEGSGVGERDGKLLQPLMVGQGLKCGPGHAFSLQKNVPIPAPIPPIKTTIVLDLSRPSLIPDQSLRAPCSRQISSAALLFSAGLCADLV
jgi:hypothetical protein